MAGHSKWAQIKRKKAVTDARRGQRWTKLLKEVTVASRIGGGDPDHNARLRTAIQDARGDNVPNDNIDRAIKRGTGELEGYNLEEITYEGYAPGGVAVLVEAVTDNRNRTVADLRHLFSKGGGNLGESGCVSWLFESRGYFAVDAETLDEEAFLELALELGASDVETEGDTYEIFTAPEEYAATLDALRERSVELSAHELSKVPNNSVAVDAEGAPQVLRLMEALEEHDDVQNVWANFDIDDSLLPVDVE